MSRLTPEAQAALDRAGGKPIEPVAAQAELNNAGAILVRLRHAILTATNDDLSEPGTEKRARHIARIETMNDAMEEIVTLCAVATGKIQSGTCL